MMEMIEEQILAQSDGITKMCGMMVKMMEMMDVMENNVLVYGNNMMELMDMMEKDDVN
jgi:hypothetical protein